MEGSEICYGPGSVAGAVIGTFLTTCLLLVAAALVYRQWRRNKGKHLVLVTDPEIVEEAYAFDNPCFKDSTPGVGRSLERPASLAVQTETTTPATKDTGAGRWSTPWSNIGKHDKRRTLDDSCLGPKATRVSVVSLRSRDFTGLGFNICGNMREGIFVKDLLHRGPASESGRIHPGDRIISVKISFRSTVYEDALTILSYASPYDVELEVESGGGIGSKPATLLKKSVGPSPMHIYHPLYRSQSIPELSQQQSSSGRKYGGNATSKRLFAADPNDSSYSNYSTMNSTIKSSKSTPGNQTLERRHEEMANKTNHHHQQHHPKFGIKVLPALDGTVHRVENQNEHNTNLERRHSKKLEFVEKSNGSVLDENGKTSNNNKVNENLQQRSNIAPSGVKRLIYVTDGTGIDVPDRAAEIIKDDEGKPPTLVIPSEVPTEVHNAAMAARRNRKSSNSELLNAQKNQQMATDTQPVTPQQQQQSAQETIDASEAKSPQKGKRKAPAPPSRTTSFEVNDEKVMQDDKTINDISDYKEHERTTMVSTNEKATTKEETDEHPNNTNKEEVKIRQEHVNRTSANRRNSESDTDSEIQNSFTTIELNPSDITIHHTPVPDAAANDDEDDDVDDIYRKAASLGDLSKYESKTSATLERAQSLDMTDTGSKKRKAPLPPPEDINESTEDLTKLDQIETTFDRRKLKKSSEWGTLEDAIWSGPGSEPLQEKMPQIRKKSNGSSGGTLERSKSNVEIKIKDEEEVSPERLNVSDGAIETSLELYNLPLSKKLTQDFIRAERLFDPEEDNALARIVNDGNVVKSPTAEELDFEFRRTHPMPEDDDDGLIEEYISSERTPEIADTFEKAVRYFDIHTKHSPLSDDTKINLSDHPEELYAGKKEVVEEPMSKVTLNFGCPACDHGQHRHSANCSKRKNAEESDFSYHRTIKLDDTKDEAKKFSSRETSSSDTFETHFAKPILNLSEAATKSDMEDDDDEAAYEFGSAVTINSKNLSSSPLTDKHNVSNVSVSSGENSEDSGMVRGSMEFNDTNGRQALSASSAMTPPSDISPQKMTYITEIKVSPSNREEVISVKDDNALSDNEEIVSILESSKKLPEASSSSVVMFNVTSNGKLPAGKKPPVPPRRSDAARFVQRTDSSNPEKQIVYVSEYKSPAAKESKTSDGSSEKNFENWVFVKETDNEKQQEVNPWGNGSSPSQPVTNIVLSSSSDEKIVHK